MASGLCPVVTDIGGNRDVVSEGTTGRLVKPDDANSLASVLLEVLRDRQERARLAHEARQWVITHRDIRNVAKTYLSLFRSMCGTLTDVPQP